MRILHIDTGKQLRGGQQQVLLLLNALREMGHESMLLARERSPVFTVATESGFLVRAASAKEAWRLSRHVDIVHAHDARAHTIAAIACRSRFVVSRRVAFAVRSSAMSTWKYRRAARFLAVSRFVATQLQTAGVSEDKIDIVYDGVESVQDQIHWQPDHPAVALASSDPQKGRDLVEQAAKLAAVRVIFSGDLPDDLRHASMFVYITRSEGLGSAALLAMSMGVPVIASSVGGLAEVFVNGVSGVFVANDTHDIAHAMRSVVERPSFAHRLIEQGRARIQECFTQEHMARGTLHSYARALAL